MSRVPKSKLETFLRIPPWGKALDPIIWLHIILLVCMHILQIKKWKPKGRKDVLQNASQLENDRVPDQPGWPSSSLVQEHAY